MSRLPLSLIALGLAAGSIVSPATAATNAPASAASAKPAYTTGETPLGDLLDDPKAKAVLQKHIPDVISNSGIEMARSMTLKQVQSYAGDQITDAKLAAIDADLAKLGAK